ncbi:glycosyltransferase family 32 protein [Microbulbifer epialgicus]|uniref:Glycosyltransferase family 32 protein n=1 Tax=Microbulbifer epialgicus TaxID=393907 RepID=A0ABV4P381_9GAMM
MNESYIPKLIHVTWKSKNLPDNFSRVLSYWKSLNPNYKIVLWTDEDNRNLIREKFPFFLEVYDSYTNHIQRVDAVRYCILYTYGGIYVDLDFLPIRPLGTFFEGKKCVLSKEPPFAAERRNMRKIISNAMMASIPRLNFFKCIIDEMASNYKLFDHLDEESRVLETTGPFMLTKAYDIYHPDRDIHLIEYNNFFPFDVFEIERMYESGEYYDGEGSLSQTIAIHLFCGTWWKDTPIIYCPDKLYSILGNSEMISNGKNKYGI